MAVTRLFQGSEIKAEDISRLRAAYEQALQALGLVDRKPAIAELLAKKVIEAAQTGARDPAEIARIAAELVLAGYRVLIVEDEYFLAKDLEAALTSFGVGNVMLVADLDEALERVAQGVFDAAVVDINLRGRAAFGVADQLRKRGIPFGFSTGYGAELIPARFADVVRWMKPFDEFGVARDIVRLCQYGASSR